MPTPSERLLQNARNLKCYYKHREARAIYRKAYRKLHKAEVRAYNKKWKAGHIEQWRATQRRARLKKSYGMTVEEFDLLFLKQGKKCAICGTDEPCERKYNGRVVRRWMTDHNHKTGEVRGILCFPCNSLLGCAKDNSEILRSAIAYLTESP